MIRRRLNRRPDLRPPEDLQYTHPSSNHNHIACMAIISYNYNNNNFPTILIPHRQRDQISRNWGSGHSARTSGAQPRNSSSGLPRAYKYHPESHHQRPSIPVSQGSQANILQLSLQSPVEAHRQCGGEVLRFGRWGSLASIGNHTDEMKRDRHGHAILLELPSHYSALSTRATI